MSRRYTLNVSKDVYTHLKNLSLREIQKNDKPPSIDEMLRKLLKIENLRNNRNRRTQTTRMQHEIETCRGSQE